MTRDVDSASRQEFLNKLHVTGKNNKSIAVKSTILDKIAKFKEKIIEIGKTELDWNGYDDEDSLAGYEEFVHPLSNLFSQVDDLFNAGHYKIAVEAYRELFSIFEFEDDYGRGIRVYNIGCNRIFTQNLYQPS
jgi:hypothetical protein